MNLPGRLARRQQPLEVRLRVVLLFGDPELGPEQPLQLRLGHVPDDLPDLADRKMFGLQLLDDEYRQQMPESEHGLEPLLVVRLGDQPLGKVVPDGAFVREILHGSPFLRWPDLLQDRCRRVRKFGRSVEPASPEFVE